MKVTKTFHPANRAAWRKWLKANHDRATEIWLMYDKKTAGKRNLDYAEAVEEALCFGWIDGIAKPLDERQYVQRFSPRKKGSRWSAINRERFARMVEAGLMTDAGNVVGPHDAPPVPERWTPDQPLPEIVDRGLKGEARRNFDALPRGHRTMYVRWIIEAKQEETTKRRLQQAIAKLRKNERLM